MSFLSFTLYHNTTVQDILIALTILGGALIVVRLAIYGLKRGLRESVSKDHLEILVKIITYISYTLVIVSVMPYVGVNLSGLLLAGGVIGVAVGFASQNILNNFLSGIFLMFERPIKMGQSVSIDGVGGVVEDIRIMSTTLRNFEGLFVRIPNQKVFTAVINNFVANPVRRFEYVIGVSYACSTSEAIRVITEVIEEEPYALVKPDPVVFVDSLGESSVNIMIRVWAPVEHLFALKRRLLEKIKNRLDLEGIEIPLPQRVVWSRTMALAPEPISSIDTSGFSPIAGSATDSATDRDELLS